MIAMQYSFTLPANYDMDIIRERIVTNGPLTDGLPGLVQKGFLMNEKGKGLANFVASNNEYAPFYVWQTEEAMRDFLLSSRFEKLSQDFGRPVVQTWPIVEFDTSSTRLLEYPLVATKETVALSDSIELSQQIERERLLHRQIVNENAVYSRAVAIDIQNWQVVRFSIWPSSREDNSTAKTPLMNNAMAFHAYQLFYLAREKENAL